MSDNKDIALEKGLAFFDGNELAATTHINKYNLKDKECNYVETDPLQTIVRVMKELADNMPEEKTIDAFYENGKPTCKLNCPSEEWLKRVLKDEYNPIQSDRRYTWLEIFGKACNNYKGVCPGGSVIAAAGDDEKLQSLSNCFVVPSPSDTVAGIIRTNELMAQIYKRRGGCGVCLSSLRPDGASVNNAALKSSGAWGWANHFSNTCRDIAQNGRRGASILILHINHPDVESWATMKEDLNYCTGANISLWITDKFMKAVKEDDNFELQFPVDSDKPVYTKTVRAKELWDTICTSAWKMAEPGILNYDHITRTLPAHCYPGYEVIASNPCITKDSWILTSNGPRQVVDLIGKKFKATINGSSYSSTENGFFKTGTKEVYLLETDKGFKIKSTDNHKFKRFFLTKNINEGTWAELKDLEVGNYISLGNERGVEWEGFGNYSLGWLLGSLKGDGNIQDDYANLDYWGENRFQLLKHVLTCIGESGLTFRSDLGSDEGQKQFERIRIKSSSLQTMASGLGMTKANGKKVSELIEKTSSNFYKGFIQGWFDADGLVQGSQEKGISVRLGSTDLEGLVSIQRMLARVGIISTIYQNREEAGYRDLPNGYGGLVSYYCKSNHELVIAKDNLFLFSDLIGFADTIKQNKLESLLSAYKRKPNRERFVDRIKDITRVCTEDVYDCTIPDVSSFNANGLEVHNCSEIPLSAYDACRLISICLLDFIENPFTDKARFNFDEFEKHVRIAVHMGEGLIESEKKHILRIIDKIKREQKEAYEERKIEYQLELELWKNVLAKNEEGRRLGLGDHGWGDMFAQLCIRYDSEEALNLAKKIKELYRNVAYDESVEMAKEYGAFPIWDWELEKECEFFKTFPKDLLKKMKKYGRRHISLLTNAPTGTLSILGQCSSGIEPVFRHFYTRRRKINANDTDARVDFVDQSGDKWTEFPVFEKNIERYFNSIGKEVPKDITNEDELNKLLPDYFITSDKIDWRKRIELQSVLTEYVDHSISSTINLPENVSVETVKELYMYAWEKKLKGVTIYRENSRSGVLVSNQKEELDHIIRSEAPIRPKKLPGEVHFTSVRGEQYVVIVGLLKGAVYEVFFGKYGNQIPNKHFSGHVERKKKGIYYLCYYDEELLEYREIDINEYFDNQEYAAATRLISMSLRHGVPLEYLITQLKKSSTNISEFGSAVSRILKKYIKIEDLQAQYRVEHGDHFEVRMEDGCMKIINLETGEVESKCD